MSVTLTCGPITYAAADRLWPTGSVLVNDDDSLPVYAIEIGGNFTSPPISSPGGPLPEPPTLTRMGFVIMTDGFFLRTMWGTADRWDQTMITAVPNPNAPTPRPVAVATPAAAI